MRRSPACGREEGEERREVQERGEGERVREVKWRKEGKEGELG